MAKGDIPATWTLMAKGTLKDEDPLNLGLIGMHGCFVSNKAIDTADVVLAVGTRFSDRVALNPKKFAKDATIIQFDIDASEVDKNVSVDVSVIGDARIVLKALLDELEQKTHPEWRDDIAKWKAADYTPSDSDERLKPHQILQTICEAAGDDSIYVTDVGQHQMWAAQYLTHVKPRHFLTSGGLGTMGYGYGASIGAQIAKGKNQRVIHLTGDGSFHMNLNEAVTAVSYDLPIITVIFNNQVLGMVRQWQTLLYEKRYSSTDPHRRTDYVKLAEGFGARGWHCETPQEFEAALQEALKNDGPSWIECVIDKDEKVLPMIPAGATIEDIILADGKEAE
jgi:acetolactate synthase-1/2/3 large subunit